MQPSLPPPPSAWSQNLLDWWLGTDWFLSYAWSDGQQLVTTLHDALVARGLRVFVDRNHLRAGESIAGGGLATALQRTRGVIVIGTAAAVGNAWVRAELERAQLRGLVVVPIDVDGALAADAASATRRLPIGDLLRISHATGRPLDDLLNPIERRRRLAVRLG